MCRSFRQGALCVRVGHRPDAVQPDPSCYEPQAAKEQAGAAQSASDRDGRFRNAMLHPPRGHGPPVRRVRDISSRKCQPRMDLAKRSEWRYRHIGNRSEDFRSSQIVSAAFAIDYTPCSETAPRHGQPCLDTAKCYAVIAPANSKGMHPART